MIIWMTYCLSVSLSLSEHRNAFGYWILNFESGAHNQWPYNTPSVITMNTQIHNPWTYQAKMTENGKDTTSKLSLDEEWNHKTISEHFDSGSISHRNSFCHSTVFIFAWRRSIAFLFRLYREKGHPSWDFTN